MCLKSLTIISVIVSSISDPRACCVHKHSTSFPVVPFHSLQSKMSVTRSPFHSTILDVLLDQNWEVNVAVYVAPRLHRHLKQLAKERYMLPSHSRS